MAFASSYGQTFTATPTGTTSSTLVMMGVGVVIVPQSTGRIIVWASGTIGNSTTGDGFAYNIYEGAGTSVPTNGAAVSGNPICTLQTVTSVVTSNLVLPFALAGSAQGFAFTKIDGTDKTLAGTAYWFDLALEAVTGGTATMTGVSFTVMEF